MAFRIRDDQNNNTRTDSSGGESLAQTLGRGALRGVARGVESVAGLPGDIASTLLGLGGGLTGINAAPVQQYLPTSENIKKYGTEAVTGNYLKPQGAGEEFFDRIIGDAATLLIPGGLYSKAGTGILKGGARALATKQGLKTATKSLGKAVGVAGAANLAGWGTEEITGSPLLGQGTKLLGLVLGGTAGGRKILTERMNDDYALAATLRKGIKPLRKAQNESLVARIKGTLNKYGKGTTGPDKEKVNDILAPLNNLFKRPETIKGRVQVPKTSSLISLDANPLPPPSFKQPRMPEIATVDELINAKKGLYQELKRIEDTGGLLSKDALRDISNVASSLESAIEKAGQGQEWLKPYKQANELHGALNGAMTLGQLIRGSKNANKVMHNPLVKALFHGLPIGVAHTLGLAKGTGVAAAGAGVYLGAREGAKAWHLLANSALARKYYKEVVKAGFARNTAAMTHALAKLDKEADRFDKTNTKPIGSFRVID